LISVSFIDGPRTGEIAVRETALSYHYLQAQYRNNLDAHLTELEQATAKVWQRLIEEHLY